MKSEIGNSVKQKSGIQKKCIPDFLWMKLILLICFTIFYGCENTDQRLFEKRVKEAKWLYYESNFMRNGVGCVNQTYNKEDNICFIENLKIDTNSIGDTLEIIIFSIKDQKILCFTYPGVHINLFGFYPGIDTVGYRASSEAFIEKRVLEEDSMTEKLLEMGVYPRAKQKEMFIDFIQQNSDKINSWLKQESKARGYID